MSTDTPDYLPQARLGGGYVTYNQVITVPAIGEVVTTPQLIGTYPSAWAQVIFDGNWPGAFGIVYSNDATRDIVYNTNLVQKTTEIESITETPVIGQYGCLVLKNDDSSPHTVTYSLFGSNGGSNPAFLLVTEPQIDEQGVTITHGTTSSFYPTVMVGGHYKVWTQSSEPGFISLKVWNGSAWDYVAYAALAVAPGAIFDVVAPSSDWRIDMSNTAGSDATAYLAVSGPY